MISHEQGIASTVVYKHKRQKLVICQGKWPTDIDSNVEALEGDDNEIEVIEKQQPKPKQRKTSENEGRRNSASPARLFKLNQSLSIDHKNVIKDIEFGGLLEITATSMPEDLGQWIMKHYYPEMSQIVIPDRGKILVDAESVQRIWGLPNKGRKVFFEMNPDVIREFNSIYKIKGKNAPALTAWCKMIEQMRGAADDNFLWA